MKEACYIVSCSRCFYKKGVTDGGLGQLSDLFQKLLQVLEAPRKLVERWTCFLVKAFPWLWVPSSLSSLDRWDTSYYLKAVFECARSRGLRSCYVGVDHASLIDAYFPGVLRCWDFCRSIFL